MNNGGYIQLLGGPSDGAVAEYFTTPTFVKVPCYWNSNGADNYRKAFALYQRSGEVVKSWEGSDDYAYCLECEVFIFRRIVASLPRKRQEGTQE